ncbi:hypothetical protein AB1Y20_007377 [Prymnesium parvum]|uniref:Uncharacterized protein n=1 Tax=Prymnesium parvum TaxID=97485 RepID=A0AB34IV43_PRYPA
MMEASTAAALMGCITTVEPTASPTLESGAIEGSIAALIETMLTTLEATTTMMEAPTTLLEGITAVEATTTLLMEVTEELSCLIGADPWLVQDTTHNCLYGVIHN